MHLPLPAAEVNIVYDLVEPTELRPASGGLNSLGQGGQGQPDILKGVSIVGVAYGMSAIANLVDNGEGLLVSSSPGIGRDGYGSPSLGVRFLVGRDRGDAMRGRLLTEEPWARS